jgi:oxygen-independent coproporphyrinogen-3 oxidase
MPLQLVDGLLNTIRSKFNLSSKAEITIEANPKTIDKTHAKGLFNAGVNRLSIGIQSVIDSELKLLGRAHGAQDAISCVHDMSSVFDNISIDMIYNRPNQKLDDWKEELGVALSLPVKHASLYELIIEDGTKMKYLIESGKLPRPDSGPSFFDLTFKIAESYGFGRYEVSNFAKPGYEGIHNIGYWRYADYYGVGPGSHSRVSIGSQKIAISQETKIAHWLHWARNPVFDLEYLSDDDVIKEKLIVGLRSNVGFSVKSISSDLRKLYDFERKIKALSQDSYIMFNGDTVVLNHRGLTKLNMIVDYLSRKLT